MDVEVGDVGHGIFLFFENALLLRLNTATISSFQEKLQEKTGLAGAGGLTSDTAAVTLHDMIKSFRHKGLEEFFFSGAKKGIRPEHADRLEVILDRLNAAHDIKDMNYPGSNLHKLIGDKKGMHAVKVSGNWRVFFEFADGDAHVVDYGDYH